ncbi:SEC11-like protein C [Cladochytrium replicatum]|nr:SEC11-like protein C [Cladochytrium replicatum]
MDMVQSLRRMSVRQIAQQVLSFLLILASALMIWKGLAVVTNSESPIVVVLSASMEPAFQRGDLLFLALDNEPIRAGDVVVFKVNGKDIPIVHRVLWLHDDDNTGKQYLLTKGDNNAVDDRGLYNPGQMWIHREDIVGKVQGFVPYVGMVTIALNDYPQLKYALVGLLGIFVLFSKDE